MLIRPAVVADIPSLCRLERECFSLPWSESSFESFFANDCSRAFAAELDGEVVGYIGLYLVCGDGEITNLAVSASARRRGIGRALLEAAMRLEGLEHLLLDVRESNFAARALYESCGFQVDGIRRRFYEKPTEDAVLMSRTVE